MKYLLSFGKYSKGPMHEALLNVYSLFVNNAKARKIFSTPHKIFIVLL